MDGKVEEPVYYLNGKRVKSSDLEGRTNLKRDREIMHIYFTADKNEAELAQDRKDVENAHKYFREQAEMRNEMERYHG